MLASLALLAARLFSAAALRRCSASSNKYRQATPGRPAQIQAALGGLKTLLDYRVKFYTPFQNRSKDYTLLI